MTHHPDIVAQLKLAIEHEPHSGLYEDALALIEAQAAEIERLREALDRAPIIASTEDLDRFRARQGKWLRTDYATAIASGEYRKGEG